MPEPSSSYAAIHSRLRRRRGLASTHTCECGEQAAQWSWDGSGEVTMGTSGGAIVRYSTDISRYQPLCSVCHKARDPRPWSLRLRETA